MLCGSSQCKIMLSRPVLQIYLNMKKNMMELFCLVQYIYSFSLEIRYYYYFFVDDRPLVLDLIDCILWSNLVFELSEQVLCMRLLCSLLYSLLCHKPLKGVWHEIFHKSVYPIRTISNFFENSRRYSQMNVYQRCQWHRQKKRKFWNKIFFLILLIAWFSALYT
jgi:hypothetical protein